MTQPIGEAIQTHKTRVPLRIRDLPNAPSQAPSPGWTRLLARQRELEDRSRAEGRKLFEERLLDAQGVRSTKPTGTATTVGAVQRFIPPAIHSLTKGINHFLSEADAPGRRGPKPHAKKWCEELGAEAAAYLTVITVLDSIYKKPRISDIARAIGERAQFELRCRRLEAEEPRKFERTQRKLNKKTRHKGHKMKVLSAEIRKSEIDVSDLSMNGKEKLKLGLKLLELFCGTNDLTRVVEKRGMKQFGKSGRGFSDRSYLDLTPEGEAALDEINEALAALQVIDYPMLVQPLPWAPGERGGYRYALRDYYPFITGKRDARKMRRKLAHALYYPEAPKVDAAINALQETAWRVNTRVLDLVKDLLFRKRSDAEEIAGIVAELADESKPHDIETNPDARRRYSQQQTETLDRNYQLRYDRRKQMRTYLMARDLKDEAAIYFPYNVDFRGRIYCIPDRLSPQGDDLSRALLTFAEAKPVGKDGARFLAIHGANCLGDVENGPRLSQVTFDERIAWIEEHTPEILRVAADPFGDEWWTSASDPLQFYAFCVEWSRYVASGKAETYMCSLPVHQDGSCNGMQHYAAMLRDETAAASVNLIPQDVPRDLYSDVLNEVRSILDVKSESGSPTEQELARLWIGSKLLTRKLCKSPAMTYFYGAKKKSVVEKMEQYLYRRDRELGKDNPNRSWAIFGKQRRQAVQFMADVLLGTKSERGAIAKCAGRAESCMTWLRKTAHRIGANGYLVQWQAPLTGFQVIQLYPQWKEERIKTAFGTYIHYTETNKIRPKKQANATAPNVIHSLDAAALVLTVIEAATEGVKSFGMIHDSYATVPGDYAILARATRNAFARLHEYPVMQWMHEQLKWHFPEGQECPEPPATGTLDVREVLRSDYFFA